VAITLARERPTSTLCAIDLSADAIAVARDNGLRLGAVHQIHWIAGDLYGPLSAGQDRFDLIVANPPYIPESDHASLPVDIKDFEPRLALLGGDDGLAVVRRIVSGAPRYLRPGGVLALEVGGHAQAAPVAQMLEDAGFVDVVVAKDYGGNDRVVSGALGRQGPP
jgi:release factor glutamine methyltransferase